MPARNDALRPMGGNNDLFAAEKLNVGLYQKAEFALIISISGTSRGSTPSLQDGATLAYAPAAKLGTLTERTQPYIF